jgi:DNA-binding MurR/RpiR family transcriptional regulator
VESGFSSFPQASFDELIAKLQREAIGLPKQEAKLAQYMILNSASLGLETGKSLAGRVGVSEVTVGRLMRRLGCDGMKGLKQLLREHYSVLATLPADSGGIPGHLIDAHEAELKAVTNVFKQANGQEWQFITALLAQSEIIYVTGFQSVRGLAEDFCRRLALARKSVHFLSAHDNMLGEWLGEPKESDAKTCLVMIDVVPYSQESQKLARLAMQQGRHVVLVTDEYCNWGRDVASGVIYAPSKTGLFLESTVGLLITLSLLVDATARASPEAARRLVQWKSNSKKIGLF